MNSANYASYGGEHHWWGATPNNEGFMQFVDNLWTLLNRIFTVLLIVCIILFVILAIVGWTPVKVLVTGEPPAYSSSI